MLGVSVVCAETDEHARWLAAPGGLAFLRLRQGRPGRYPTPEEAAARQLTPAEKEAIRGWTGSHVVGDPDTVVAQLAALVERTGVQELMLSTMVTDVAERRRSATLVAAAAGLIPAGAAAGAGPG